MPHADIASRVHLLGKAYPSCQQAIPIVGVFPAVTVSIAQSLAPVGSRVEQRATANAMPEEPVMLLVGAAPERGIRGPQQERNAHARTLCLPLQNGFALPRKPMATEKVVIVPVANKVPSST